MTNEHAAIIPTSTETILGTWNKLPFLHIKLTQVYEGISIN
jgi:hypothetical protein